MLTRMWRRTYKPVIGLDIGTTAVRALALDSKGPSYRVLAAGEAVLPSQCQYSTSTDVKDILALKAAIQAACYPLPKKSCSVITALADSAVINKTIPIYPNDSEDEILAQALLAASQATNYPLSELYCDYQVLENPVANTRIANFVATRSHTIDIYREIIEEIGGVLSIIDVESNVIAQNYHRFVPAAVSKTFAIYDLGTTRSLLVIMDEAKPVYVQAETLGSSQLIQKITEFHQADEVTAQQLMHTGAFSAALYQQVILPFYQALVQQLKRHLQQFISGTNDASVQQIFISGAGASFTDLSAYCSQIMNCRVEKMATFTHCLFARPELATRLMPHAPAWFLSCALAMRGLSE